MALRRVWLIGLLAGALAGCAAPREACKPQPIALVRMHFIHNEPVFNGVMNGARVPMLFDTGAQGSLVTPRVVQRLRIPVFYNRNIKLYGAGGFTRAPMAKVVRFQMGVAVGTSFTFHVAQLEDRRKPGLRSLGGVIGDDVFQNYDIDLDFPHDQALLIDTASCSSVVPWSGPLHPVRFRRARNGAAEVPVLIDGRRVTALLDTGAAGTVMSRGMFDRLGLGRDHPVVIRHGHGTGVGARRFRITVYRLHTLAVAGVVWRDPVIAVGSDIGEMGSFILLGENFIRQHEIYISYPRRLLWVRAG